MEIFKGKYNNFDINRILKKATTEYTRSPVQINKLQIIIKNGSEIPYVKLMYMINNINYVENCEMENLIQNDKLLYHFAKSWIYYRHLISASKMIISKKYYIKNDILKTILILNKTMFAYFNFKSKDVINVIMNYYMENYLHSYAEKGLEKTMQSYDRVIKEYNDMCLFNKNTIEEFNQKITDPAILMMANLTNTYAKEMVQSGFLYRLLLLIQFTSIELNKQQLFNNF